MLHDITELKYIVLAMPKLQHTSILKDRWVVKNTKEKWNWEGDLNSYGFNKGLSLLRIQYKKKTNKKLNLCIKDKISCPKQYF